jgi:hypothetical protein
MDVPDVTPPEMLMLALRVTTPEATLLTVVLALTPVPVTVIPANTPAGVLANVRMLFVPAVVPTAVAALVGYVTVKLVLVKVIEAPDATVTGPLRTTLVLAKELTVVPEGIPVPETDAPTLTPAGCVAKYKVEVLLEPAFVAAVIW